MPRTLALLAALAACFPTLASAFELPRPGQTHCYGRAYSGAHFAQHPGQVAQTLILELINWSAHQTTGFYLSVVLSEEGDQIWGTGGACYPEGAGQRCEVDCDGGGFLLTASSGGDLLLRNDRQGFAIQGNCGDELSDWPAVDHMPADADNAVYRLVRLPDDFCPQWE